MVLYRFIMRHFFLFLFIFGVLVTGYSQNHKSDKILLPVKQKKFRHRQHNNNQTKPANTVRALQYAEHVLRKAEEANDSMQMASMYTVIGDVYFSEKSYHFAMQYYLNAFEIYRNINNKTELAYSFMDIGDCYKAQNNIDVSFDYYVKAKDTCQSIGDQKGVSVAFDKLGDLFIDLDPKLALKNYNASLKIRRQLNAQEAIAYSHTNIARAYKYSEQYKDSENHINKALQIYEQYKDRQNIAKLLFMRGELQLLKEAYDSAEENFRNVISIFSEYNNSQAIIDAYLKLSETFSKQQQFNDALSFAKNALRLTDSLSLMEKKRDVFLMLSTIYHAQAKCTLAFEFYKKYNALNDSLEQKAKSDQFSKYQLSYEKLMKNKEIEILEVENEKRLLKQKYEKYFFIGIAAIALAGIVVFSLRYREKNRATKMLLTKNQQIHEQKEELQQTFERLSENEKKLRLANQTKDRLFSIIGHDLRNPIGAIKSILDELVAPDSPFDEESKNEILKDLSESAQNTYILLENLLCWAKNQSGDIQFKPERIKIRELIKQNTGLLNHNAQSKQISIKLPNLDDVEIFADKNMINTVIRNLLSNAIKFTPEGGEIRISTKINDKKDNIQLFIEDTGVGIPKENIDKLFDSNIHFSTYGTHDEKGSGLGLILCKEFIEMHNGTIHVESVQGKGSTFIIDFPVNTSSKPEA